MSIVKSFSFPCGDIRGDMFYIKHNSNNFTVIDCYLTDEDNENGRKDEIIAEILRESSGRTCRFISTHPDHDHIAGIEHLDNAWKIINFYAVQNNHPSDATDPSLTRYLWLLTNKNYPIERGISRCWLNEKNENNGASGIKFFWPDLNNDKFKEALNKVSQGEETNNICPIITYSISGGAVYMWMGDLETEMQKTFYDEFKDSIPQIDILFQPHHGRKSGSLPPELLEALNPKLIIIGNAPAEHINYGNSRQTITQNTSGDIMFINRDHFVDIFTKNRIDNPPICLKRIEIAGEISYLDWFYVGSLEL